MPPADLHPFRIFLIRHARPAVSRRGRFGREQANQYIQDYDSADITYPVERPDGVPYHQIRKVYCSTLNRSKRTAAALFGSVPLVEDPAFNEFERRVLRLPLLKFPIWVWLAASRVLWLLGLNSQGIETFRKARHRARQAAAHLAEQARQEGLVVLVAHGFLNAFIRRSLEQLGWQVVRKDGSQFLGVTELVGPPRGKQKQ